MARQLVIMGSGETTPTMVETHKRLLAGIDDARLVDTPYGFQENADELTAKTLEYFRHNAEHDVTAIELRDTGALSPAALEDRLAACAEADWFFAGPGSPTYALRQWETTRFPAVMRERLRRDGTITVFASAAACAVGVRTVPVYEIYKVGAQPHWRDGLRLVDELDLDCVVIPHWDNAEGGGHDTRFCYLGERRLSTMEAELDSATWVLGIDEHTALVIDADTGACRIEGRGGVTVRVRGRHTTFTADDELTLDRLRATAAGTDQGATPAVADAAPDEKSGIAVPDTTTVLGESVAHHQQTFDDALADGRTVDAADAVLALEAELRVWAADSLQSDALDDGRASFQRMVVALARAADTGLTDPRDRIRPFVTALLELRATARAAKDWATADRIRDALTEGDLDVRDTPDGVTWDLAQPPAQGRPSARGEVSEPPA